MMCRIQARSVGQPPTAIRLTETDDILDYEHDPSAWGTSRSYPAGVASSVAACQVSFHSAASASGRCSVRAHRTCL